MDFLNPTPEPDDPADAWKNPDFKVEFNKDAPFEPPPGFTPHQHKLFSKLNVRLDELHVPHQVVNQFFHHYPHQEAINDFFEGKVCMIIQDGPERSMGFLKPKGEK